MTKEVKKIVIIRLSSIGDVVLTTPVIKSLRNKYPNSQIDYITCYPSNLLLEHDRNVDKVLIYKKSNRLLSFISDAKSFITSNNIAKYDICIDFHNNLRTKLLSKTLSGKVFSVKKNRIRKLLIVWFKKKFYDNFHILAKYYQTIDELQVEKFFTPELSINKSITKQAISHNIIGICPGANHFTKRYPKEKFAELINYLLNINPNLRFYIFGNLQESEIAQYLNSNCSKCYDFMGKLDLNQTAEKMSECSVIISNDTGLMHISTALDIYTLAIFGGTSKDLGFYPLGSKSIVVEQDLNCRPCSHIGRSDCPLKHFNCMNQISKESITESLKKLKPEILNA